ncbi:MAG: DNA-binding transcriptional MerR regulator [Rickettsiales bacterium]|jgi:DNA-binding transcriptional MerR regulator
MEKIIDKKRSIGGAAKEIGVKTHVIRFWEEKFPQIKPEIGKGDRRYYFDSQMEVLHKVKSLLHDEGYSIAGLQKLLGKRKISEKKQENIDFLLEEGSVKDFSIDDFIDPNLQLGKKIDENQKGKINEIIVKIADNLKKLEEV